MKKKDGSWGFWVDYRALNHVIVKDRYLIPAIDELFDELHIGYISTIYFCDKVKGTTHKSKYKQ